MSKKNEIDIAGNGNITIQDVDGSTINVNAHDTAAFETFFKQQSDEIKQYLKAELKKLSIFPFKAKELSLKTPHISPDKIIGREKDLDDLRDRLSNNKQVVLVNGLGGIGKTTLAMAYVGKYIKNYQHILWISQLSGNFRDDIIQTEGLMQNLGISTAGKEAAQLYAEIMGKLKSISDGPNLLIIDNAEAELHRHYHELPKQPKWHILVTSREHIEQFDIKSLDFLLIDDAILLFEKHYTLGKLSREEIKELVEAIDRHTLTIEILAKTAQRQRTPIQELKAAIEDDLRAYVYIQHKADKIERVTSYLSSIFVKSLEKINEDERWLMRQFVCLPSEFHSYELLSELINPATKPQSKGLINRIKRYFKNKPKNQVTLAEQLNGLTEKGWLLQDDKGYKMHRIILEVISRQLSLELETVLPLIENITNKLHVDETKDNPVDKFIWIPFGEAILFVFEKNTSPKIAALQNNLALVLQDLGDYTGAKKLLNKAMISDEQNFGVNHPNTAVIYSNLALVLQALGDYAGAKELLNKAIISNEQNFGVNHPNTAKSYSNLALVLPDLGDYAGAKELLNKAIISAEQNFGVNHPTTALRYSNLATVLKDLGDYAGAKELLNKAIISAEQNFGVNHPNTSVTYSNLATVLKDLGDYAGAKELLNKAIISTEQNFGVNHPNTARSYSNLATVLYHKKEFKSAVSLLEKAYAVYKNHLGNEHPNTKKVKENLDFIKKNTNN